MWLVVAPRMFRPRFDISPKIAVAMEDGAFRYVIKFVNRSRRGLLDVQWELVHLQLKHMEGGQINRRTRICTKAEPPLIIPGLQRKSTKDDNAFRLSVATDDLRDLLRGDEGSRIRLKIFARDATSGIGHVEECVYQDPDTDFVEGTFAKGQVYTIS